MRRIGVMIGIALTVAGVAVGVWQHVERQAYATLSARVTQTASGEECGTAAASARDSGIDWNALRGENPDIAAWIEIEGTDISLPIVNATSGDADFYLTHDFWGRSALEGTPYLDHRCEVDGAHRLVYGHHLSTGGQFSELQGVYEQEAFERLGGCRWHTPEGGETRLLPLFALRVDCWFQEIQQFSFPNPAALHEWLESLERKATAHGAKASGTGEAISVVTLVTCSSDFAHQPWRTLVVFGEMPSG